MRQLFIPDSFFNRFLPFGFWVDDDSNEEIALSLGLVISECLFLVSDPAFISVEKRLKFSTEHKFSMAHSGSLLHARISKKSGTTIVLGTPPWCKDGWEGILAAYKLLLVTSYQNFLKDISAESKWIFPIRIETTDWLSDQFKFPREYLEFNEAWLPTEAIGMLRYLITELSQIDPDAELLKMHRFAQSLIDRAERFQTDHGAQFNSIDEKGFSRFVGEVVEQFKTDRLYVAPHSL